MNYLTRDTDNKIKALCQWCRVAIHTKTGAYARTIGRAAETATCANCGISHTRNDERGETR
jgi:NMD protein affecting ribosome stability and mRNA decay